jgi:hypothetical protein
MERQFRFAPSPSSFPESPQDRMMETSPTNPPTEGSRGAAERPLSSRLAGGLDRRELEEMEHRRKQAWQSQQRWSQLFQIVTVLALLGAVGVGVVTWRDLNRKHFEASEPLKYISIQYEQQRVEILRYAPFHERQERQQRRKLDRAFGEVAAEDLSDQVKGISEVRAILRPRAAQARHRVRREFPRMLETFEVSLEDSDFVISDLTTKYNQASKTYNQAASQPSATLVRLLCGLPAKLPPMKN